MDLPTIFLVLSTIVALTASSTMKIDPRVLDQARLQGTSDIIVHMTEDDVESIHAHARSLINVNHRKRSEELYIDLKGYADKVQRNVLELLEKRKTPAMKVKQLWSVNRISAKNVTIETIKLISDMTDVSAIREDRKFPLAQVFDVLPVDNLDTNNRRSNIQDNQWNVDRIGASSIWSYYNNMGQGIVVSNIDTGCRVSHVCLQDKFIDGCWWDPYLEYDTPTDPQGHGTHTMGTICGGCGVGVAPGAKFSTCRGCAMDSCTESALLECGGWMIHPTDAKKNYMPQCIPHLVSNSWGGDSMDPFYMAQVNAWHSAGIMNVFSCGNSGPNCSTISSPGDYNSVTCAAATDELDQLAWFSSRGPSGYIKDPAAKPNIAAPGVSILSAYITNDTSGAYMSGTSMAAPHVAGAAALMLNFVKEYAEESIMSPECMYRLAYALIEKSAQPGNFNGTIQCGEVYVSARRNPFFGSGICNVKEAYAMYESLKFDALC